jgi:hypothetical protein
VTVTRGSSDRRDVMYNVDDLKNKRSQAAAKSKKAKSKKIAATVDHNSGNNKKWANVKESISPRITMKRLKTRRFDLMNTRKARKARKVKRMTTTHPQ